MTVSTNARNIEMTEEGESKGWICNLNSVFVYNYDKGMKERYHYRMWYLVAGLNKDWAHWIFCDDPWTWGFGDVHDGEKHVYVYIIGHSLTTIIDNYIAHLTV